MLSFFLLNNSGNLRACVSSGSSNSLLFCPSLDGARMEDQVSALVEAVAELLPLPATEGAGFEATSSGRGPVAVFGRGRLKGCIVCWGDVGEQARREMRGSP